jgi:hypothetical protein
MNESNAGKESYWRRPGPCRRHDGLYSGLCIAHNKEEMEQCVHFSPGSGKYACFAHSYSYGQVHTVCGMSLDKVREEGAAV